MAHDSSSYGAAMALDEYGVRLLRMRMGDVLARGTQMGQRTIALPRRC
ncbi:hypothetical protein ACIBAG_35920 [Streptomyces sp. NPDC051243]